jgi:hypothetical protein
MNNNTPGTLPNGVKARRTKRQSKAYSDLHRYAGKGINMIDIDSIEFDSQGNSLALIETKHLNEAFSDFQRLCITKHSNKASIPAFEVRHDYDVKYFYVYPLNDLGTSFLQAAKIPEAQRMDRTSYLIFLHAIHGSIPSMQDVNYFISFQVSHEDACQGGVQP